MESKDTVKTSQSIDLFGTSPNVSAFNIPNAPKNQ